MLYRRLYRRMMKIGQQFDRRPAFKAFVFTDKVSFEYGDEQESEIVYNYTNYEKSMQDLLRSFCSPGQLYVPKKLLTNLIKNAFRGKNNGVDGSEIGLNRTESIDLIFLSMRYLFRCQNIAFQLTEKHEPLHLLNKWEAKLAPVELLPEMCDGALLLSHPLWMNWPYSNSLVLVSSYSEDHAVGFILNKLYRSKFKNAMTKRERIQSRGKLQSLYDCPCYYGGNDQNLGPFNFSVLHTSSSLASISQEVQLPMRDSSSEVNSNAGTEINGIHSIFICNDLPAIGNAVTEGLIGTEDIKILYGCLNWTDRELADNIKDNKFIPIRSTGVNISIDRAQSSDDNPRTIMQHAAMCSNKTFERPSLDSNNLELGSIAEPPSTGDTGNGEHPLYLHWQDPSIWGIGYYTWSKLFTFMSGEYSYFSHVREITTMNDAPLYLEQLEALSRFSENPGDTEPSWGDDSVKFYIANSIADSVASNLFSDISIEEDDSDDDSDGDEF